MKVFNKHPCLDCRAEVRSVSDSFRRELCRDRSGKESFRFLTFKVIQPTYIQMGIKGMSKPIPFSLGAGLMPDGGLLMHSVFRSKEKKAGQT